jgi:hypothetical protein
MMCCLRDAYMLCLVWQCHWMGKPFHYDYESIPIDAPILEFKTMLFQLCGLTERLMTQGNMDVQKQIRAAFNRIKVGKSYKVGPPPCMADQDMSLWFGAEEWVAAYVRMLDYPPGQHTIMANRIWTNATAICRQIDGKSKQVPDVRGTATANTGELAEIGERAL